MTSDAEPDDAPVAKPSPDEAMKEAEFLAAAESLLEKSAAVPEDFETPADEVGSDRLEDRPTVDDSEPDDEDSDRPAENEWVSKPTVRHQARLYPDSVRHVDPETKVLNLSSAPQLAELNRIQKAAADPEAPTLYIAEMAKQPFEGSWVVYVTFYKVQYCKI
jgi:hypothetical protein